MKGEIPFSFFDLDAFLSELHRELKSYGVSDRVIKASIRRGLAAATSEEEEGD